MGAAVFLSSRGSREFVIIGDCVKHILIITLLIKCLDIWHVFRVSVLPCLIMTTTSPKHPVNYRFRPFV